MFLLIDNYDSFTYNLYHFCAAYVDELIVIRNDKISVEEIIKLSPEAIVLSPGPKSPFEAGICLELIGSVASTIPILGVCLGMQAIGAAFGAEVIRAPFPMHGKTSEIFHLGKNLFENLPLPMIVGRYHSLMIQKASMPSCLFVDAATQEGIVMGLRHRDFPCFGVQFHPESVLTEGGDHMIRNFFKIAECWNNNNKKQKITG